MNKIQKTIPELLYPEGEHNAQKFSDLQHKYWNIETKNAQNNDVNTSTPIVDEKSLSDDEKTIMEFNQQRQKLFPLPAKKEVFKRFGNSI